MRQAVGERRARWLVGVSLAASLLAPAAGAGVRWAPVGEDSLEDAVGQAGREDGVVLLVISDPTWCLPCAELHERWLDNPEAAEVARLTEDLRVVLIDPTEAEGARALERHGVRYQGLPSVLAFRPEAGSTRLGDGSAFGGLVGAPSDFPRRLEELLSGEDPAVALRSRLAEEASTLERARLHLQLGDLLAARGDATGARRAYDAAETACSIGDGASSHAELCRFAAWKAVGVRLQMLDDPSMGLSFLARFQRRHGDDEQYLEARVFGRALGLIRLEREAEALEVLEEHLAGRAPSASELEALAWTCLRSGAPELLRFAERKAREAITQLPERQARCLALVARLLAAQGNERDAAQVLNQAIVHADDEEERAIYRRQLRRLAASRG